MRNDLEEIEKVNIHYLKKIKEIKIIQIYVYYKILVLL